MLTRPFGKTGWNCGVIGFGAWGIGGQWGAVAEAQAIATLKAAYDAGINFFDTADAYGEPSGLSEELIGKALGPVRDRVLVASKVGNWARRMGKPLPYTDPLHVELCCDASLYRLKSDVIDLYQCHIGDLREPDVFLAAFDVLLKKGKIRAFGVSTHLSDVVTAFDRDGKCAAVQLDYSILNRVPEDELLPLCARRNIATVIRGPLAMGVATGKFTRDTKFTDSVRSGWNDGAGREKYLQRVATMEKLAFLATPARPMARAALQYVISHPAVNVAIPGAKSPEQVRANAAAGQAVLSGEELARIRAIG